MVVAGVGALALFLQRFHTCVRLEVCGTAGSPPGGAARKKLWRMRMLPPSSRRRTPAVFLQPAHTYVCLEVYSTAGSPICGAALKRRPPLHAAYDSGEVCGVGVLVNTHLAVNIDSYESLTTRFGRLRLKRCGSMSALTVFVAYAPTSDYDDEEVEAFYVELEKFYKEDHTLYKVIVGDF
ncbi:unnamed protein product, partial [Heligmosomoides polygyrus]|uniref:Staygreen domain-containing protein n=1 Tax=Heligmosomoides polygyrus TaxID=6339 RepID=A0A183GGI7_HELPZ